MGFPMENVEWEGEKQTIGVGWHDILPQEWSYNEHQFEDGEFTDSANIKL
jgi:hypothetical protein